MTETIDLEPGTKRDHEQDLATPDGSSREHAAPHLRSDCTSAWQKKIEQCTPAPVVRWGRKAGEWAKGPKPRHKKYAIHAWLERWQTLPTRLLVRLPRWMRVGIYSIACITWIVIFAVVISDNALPSDIGGFGAPVKLSCVNSLWYGMAGLLSSPQTCGVDGRACLPFSNASFAFNCPAGCVSAQVLNPHAIGSKTINYRPLVVGGTSPGLGKNDAHVYRGDSFICGAAIHAGVVGNSHGGCGILSLEGKHDNFGGMTRNGISSISFDSDFPMAFSFEQTSLIAGQCRDPRWNLLVLSAIFTALFSLFTSSPATFFAPIFTILFFQTGMASDPPPYLNYASLASTTLGRFLPAALVGAVFYRFSVRETLRDCKAHVDKTILWVGGAWVGALGSYTFEQIPIQRLTGHDIQQQPGAITALIIIVLVLFAIILYQAWCFRNEGRLLRYLGLYAALGASLGVLAAMPKLNLRIHHYLIALLLLPGTALQTRVSLLCQGLLVGLFINGIARWDFDPILQTSEALRGDGQLGSSIPSILEPVVNGSSITFAWDTLVGGYEGISVIVNDVERYRGSGGSRQGSFTWHRMGDAKNEYFRFGFIGYQPFGGVLYSDFTRAGTWFSNGTWSGIPPGRT